MGIQSVAVYWEHSGVHALLLANRYSVGDSHRLRLHSYSDSKCGRSTVLYLYTQEIQIWDQASRVRDYQHFQLLVVPDLGTSQCA